MMNKELVKVLGDLSKQQSADLGGNEGFTTEELRKKLGCGRDKAITMLRGLMEEGKIESVNLVRKNIHGVTHTRPGFRQVKKESGK